MRFEPWIGSKYLSEGLAGIRVLALGESHYAENDIHCPTFTTEVVTECVYRRRVAFFTKVAKLLRGMKTEQYISNEVLRDTWDRISFYNYIQRTLPAPRIRPTDAMWLEAQHLFPRAMERLKPDLIVVMGKSLGARFRAPNSVEICLTEHPSSSGFTYEPWSSAIQTIYHRLRDAKG